MKAWGCTFMFGDELPFIVFAETEEEAADIFLSEKFTALVREHLNNEDAGMGTLSPYTIGEVTKGVLNLDIGKIITDI